MDGFRYGVLVDDERYYHCCVTSRGVVRVRGERRSLDSGNSTRNNGLFLEAILCSYRFRYVRRVCCGSCVGGGDLLEAFDEGNSVCHRCQAWRPPKTLIRSALSLHDSTPGTTRESGLLLFSLPRPSP